MATLNLKIEDIGAPLIVEIDDFKFNLNTDTKTVFKFFEMTKDEMFDELKFFELIIGKENHKNFFDKLSNKHHAASSKLIFEICEFWIKNVIKPNENTSKK